MSNLASRAVPTGFPRPVARYLALRFTLVAALIAPSAALAHDVKAPVLVSTSVSPPFTFSTQQVTATYRVTDDVSGAAPASVTAYSAYAPFQSVPATVKRISGDELDGTYTATITVPVGATGGTWNFQAEGIWDHLGNKLSGPNGTALDLGSFFVIGLGWDTTPPKLVSSSVTPAALDLAGAAGSVTVTAKVTDDYTGAKAPVVVATSASGKTITVNATLTSGTKNDGTWTAKVVFPVGSETGAWTLGLLPLVDEWGNAAKSGTSLGGLAVTSTTTGGGGGDAGNVGNGNGGGNGGGGATTTVVTTTTTSTTSTTATKPADQGGVLGARVSSRPFLTFAGSAKKLKFTKKGSLAFSLKCNGTTRCKGSVKLYVKKGSKKYKIVSRRVAVDAGKTIKVTYKLTKVGKKQVRRGKAVKPSVSIFSDGIKAPRTKTLTVSTKTLAKR
ncbi:MAG: hypothetical protein Q7T55_02950 [Solirubrobacteraceae bacterium]|nr:hypothetical protein [Solirubrobacteraceae bacterium]